MALHKEPARAKGLKSTRFTLEEVQRGSSIAATGQDRAVARRPHLLRDCVPTRRWRFVGKTLISIAEQLKIRRTHPSLRAESAFRRTASSEREVDMLALVVDELQEQRARTQLRGDLVFLNEDGGPARSHELPRPQLETNSREGFAAAPQRFISAGTRYAALQLSRGENPQYVVASDGSHQSRNDHPALRAVVAEARARWHFQLTSFPPSSRRKSLNLA